MLPEMGDSRWRKWEKAVFYLWVQTSSYKSWGCKVQHDDQSWQYCVVRSKAAKRVGLKSSHNMKTNKRNYLCWWMSVSWTYCGSHLATHTHIKASCSAPTTKGICFSTCTIVFYLWPKKCNFLSVMLYKYENQYANICFTPILWIENLGKIRMNIFY